MATCVTVAQLCRGLAATLPVKLALVSPAGCLPVLRLDPKTRLLTYITHVPAYKVTTNDIRSHHSIEISYDAWQGVDGRRWRVAANLWAIRSTRPRGAGGDVG